jgi:DNA-binding PadR family transcriptional regulator
MIRARSAEVLQIETGSLYPALHRLERQGLIAARWVVSEQRVRLYELAERGRQQVVAERSRWETLAAAIAAVLAPPATGEA